MSSTYDARHLPYDLVIACCVAASALTVVIVAEHTAPDRGDVPAVMAGLLSLLGLACTMRRGRRAMRALRTIDAQATTLGARWGIAGGLLWVAEIAFNNFLSAAVRSMDAAALVRQRDRVDNVMWTLVAVCILIATLRAARGRGWRAGVRAGSWSGLVSGALACVMALAIVVFAMPALLGDPVNHAEYADLVRLGTTRAHAYVAPRMADYFAFETLAGAYGHLWLLGVILGALIGGLGGLVGSAGARRPRVQLHRRSDPQ